jgi:hypothetical protein
MSNIQDEVEQAAKSTGSLIRKLPSGESETLRMEVARRFGRGLPTGFLWEHFSEASSVHDPEAWRWIADYIKDTKVFMFFNQEDDTAVFELVNGADIVPVLAECALFEFYVTNPAVDYVLCHNHHDYLIATGTAISWLEKWKRLHRS